MAPMATCFVLFLVQVRAAEVSCGSGGVCEDSSMLQIESSPVRPRAVGGQKDEHGCLTAAGYSWDPEYGKCIQPWNKPQKLEILPLPPVPLIKTPFCKNSPMQLCRVLCPPLQC